MTEKIQWIDFKALEQEDNDENFGLFDFLFWGSRYSMKHWWFVFIPIINGFYGLVSLITLFTIPLRWYINANQLKQLKKNAYDIEDTYSDYRLIRNKCGEYGLCVWRESFTFNRKILIESKYIKIERWQETGYIVTDKDHRVGLYNSENRKWIFPCICNKIEVESQDIIIVTIDNKPQRYNIKGYRIINNE